MTDHDDAVSRRYRELPREEPPAALDAAILSHARRATMRPRSRWAGPVSIAAVLVLALGITLRMQHEEPGIETSPPVSAPPASAPSASPPATVTIPATAPLAPQPQPQPRMEENVKPLRKRQVETPRAQGRVAEPQPTQAREAEARPAPAAPPPAAVSPPAAAALPPASASAPAAAAAPAPLQRRAAERTRDETDVQRDAELERIAKLREEGDDDAADAALAAFRERYPAYRIPDATWARVKPR